MKRILILLVIGLILMSITRNEVDSLICYECEEDFDKKQWNPYTDCQIFPNLTNSQLCLPGEIYCMVKKVSFKGITISIQRKCTDSCWYGCRAKDFGPTKITCVSCCQDNLCNIAGVGSVIVPSVFVLMVAASLSCL